MRVSWALCLSALSFSFPLLGSRGLAFWVVSFAAPESWHQIGTPFGRCFCLNIFTSCEVGRPLYLIRDWRARGGLRYTGERVRGRGRRRRPRDNLRRLIPSALRFVVLFSSCSLRCLGIFSCTLSVSCLSGIHLEDAKTVFSFSHHSPLRPGKRHALFPSTTPPNASFSPHFGDPSSHQPEFLFLFNFSCDCSLTCFICLASWDERTDTSLLFFSFGISGNTLLTQTGNRRGKAVEEYGRKKKGETNDEDIQIPTPLAGATFFFRLFAAVQDHHTSLARDKLTYFLC